VSPETAAGVQAHLSAAGRLGIVRRFAERLSDARDLAEVLAAVDEGTREALGASSVSVSLVARGRSELLALLPDGGRRPLDDELPEAAVVRGGEPVLWAAPEAGALLPMIVDGTVTGVLGVGWSARRRFSRTDTALMRVIAQQCALAVDRARLQQFEREERDTLELLNEAIRILVGPLDPSEIVRSLVRLAVPQLAPWCAVYVADRKRLRRVAIEVAGDPGFAAELQGGGTVPIDAEAPLALSFRTGETLVVPEVSAEMVRRVYDADLAARILRHGHERPWTALVVPVKAAGRTIGVMSLVSREWRGDPPHQIRHAAEGLAGRAGIAIFNADSFERERLTAALLTEALLPGDLPTIPGHEVAARYLPAAGAVAGDWFDVAHLPSGLFLLGLGDAAGQGIPAASLMARLRNAARGVAVGGEAPSGILHGLSLLIAEDDAESLAAACYATLEPAQGAVVWAAAGHVPPLVWSASGDDARYLAEAQRPPLGVPSTSSPLDHALQLDPGDALVLVSDGVLERRDADFGERLGILRSLVVRHGERRAAELADLLQDVLCDAPEDDCCMLVLKRL
jgi:GAF domain-containing protein